MSETLAKRILYWIIAAIPMGISWEIFKHAGDLEFFRGLGIIMMLVIFFIALVVFVALLLTNRI